MEQILEAVNYLRAQRIEDVDVGIVLGTGLGKLAERVQIIRVIKYESIPHFPVSTVEFHRGELIYGSYNEKKVLMMHGRFHYYEGYTLRQVTFPVRVMKLLGIKSLLLSNACGSVNPEFKKGGLMLLNDHINLLPDNPLVGPNYDELGPRFPDMSEPYSHRLNGLFREVAAANNIKLNEGVYVVVAGPNLETRAEYRFFQIIQADVVGMSTVPEVIVANHMGLPCAAVSVITDECDPDNLSPINIADVIKTASIAEEDLIVLMEGVLERL